MIIVRSPLRISLGGGGTDLPSYADKYGGFCLAAAIDKYAYCAINERAMPQVMKYSENEKPKMLLKYSKVEEVESIDEIRHPLIRETLKGITCYGATWTDINIELTSMADLPGGTGLGSSAAFTCAMIVALATYKGFAVNWAKLPTSAFYIEAGILKEPVGCQDHFISVRGGINSFLFGPGEAIKMVKPAISEHIVRELEYRLCLFYTGETRSAGSILEHQDVATKSGDAEMIRNLDHVKEIGLRIRDALVAGDLQEFGRCMQEHWKEKEKRSPKIVSGLNSYLCQKGIERGAVSGKLVGAGGGGFLMFLADDVPRLCDSMAEEGLKRTFFRFDWEGTKVISR